MNAYLGKVSAVSAAGRRARVFLPLPGVLTRPLRVAFSYELLAVPRVGDEVLVIETGGGLEDAVVCGWLPTAAQLAAATDPLVTSTSGSVPTSTLPGNPIAGAAVDPLVLVRP